MAAQRLARLSLRLLHPLQPATSSLSIRGFPIPASAAQTRCLPRPFSSTTHFLEKDVSPSSVSSSSSMIYQFSEISALSSSPSPTRILIDVREPSELASTGTIPTSRNIPIKSSADAFFLPAEEFEDRFGFPRPGVDVEVVFFCKSGVRSKAAATLARQAGFGGKVGEYEGSWEDWSERGGQVEKVGQK